MAQQQQQNQPQQEVVEPYKLSEIFSIIPEYDGNQINLTTFLNSCRTAYNMSIGNQVVLLTVHIKNQLTGRAAELVNSRDPTSWDEIRTLLENHFGDSRDLTSLIQDLQRMRQLPSESPLTFIARLQTHEAKMHASVNKQRLTVAQKEAQIQLTEGMVLNTLLTGLEPNLAQVVRASDPADMLTAITRVRRELQLNYFETQKPNRNNNTVTPMRNPNLSSPARQCSFCKRIGHIASECRKKQQTFRPPNFGIPQNYSRPNYYNQNPGNSQNFQQQRPNYYNQNPGTSQNFQQQRSPVITPNPNFNNVRPPAIQPNPNYYKPNTNRKTLHLNQNVEFENPEQQNQNYYCPDNPSENINEEYYTDNNAYANVNYYTANSSGYDNANEDYYTANNSPENYYTDDPTFNTTPVYNQDFRSGLYAQSDPPYYKTGDSNMTVLQTQFGQMNLDNFNPNLNFPEQQFL